MAISLNRDLLRRAAETPLQVLLWKGWQLVLTHGRRAGYWQKLSSDLQGQVDRIPIAHLRRVLMEAPQLIPPAAVEPAAQWLATHHPEEVEELIKEADDVLAFRWSLLGSELHCQGLPVPWCSDWRVGHTWPRAYYADVDYIAPGKPTDVKYPWELSRFYFAPTLGQAYRLAGNKTYERHFLALVRDWVAQNPFAWSINWCSPLEVALRGVHLVTAVSFFPGMEDDDLRFLVHQLAVHGAFLYRNIEYTDIRGNHYTGNLYGLLVLGCLLERIVPEARRWRAYAEKHIDHEILLQFYPDGVNIEKSIHYHRFVLDMFLYCTVLLDRAGSAVGARAQDRLLRALEFTAAYIRPDGAAPRVGDADDGWALRLTARSPAGHRGTLALGAAIFQRPGLCREAGGFDPKPLWLLGPDHPVDSLSANGDELRLSFPDGGYLVSKGNGCYLLFDVGEVGQRGRGGHGHHDALSFELALNGSPLFVDPGMPAYTGDVATRNRYRSTFAHNTAVVDGAEQGTLVPEQIWRLGREAHVLDIKEVRTPGEDQFAARHRGFERLTPPVRYHRQLTLNCAQKVFYGQDTFEGSGFHRIQLFFHLAPGISCHEVPGGLELRSGSSVWLFAAEGGRISAREGEVSPSYGVRIPAVVIEITAEVSLPATVSYRVKAMRWVAAKGVDAP
jgi:hypothetical protein